MVKTDRFTLDFIDAHDIDLLKSARNPYRPIVDSIMTSEHPFLKIDLITTEWPL